MHELVVGLGGKRDRPLGQMCGVRRDDVPAPRGDPPERRRARGHRPCSGGRGERAAPLRAAGSGGRPVGRHVHHGRDLLGRTPLRGGERAGAAARPRRGGRALGRADVPRSGGLPRGIRDGRAGDDRAARPPGAARAARRAGGERDHRARPALGRGCAGAPRRPGRPGRRPGPDRRRRRGKSSVPRAARGRRHPRRARRAVDPADDRGRARRAPRPAPATAARAPRTRVGGRPPLRAAGARRAVDTRGRPAAHRPPSSR